MELDEGRVDLGRAQQQPVQAGADHRRPVRHADAQPRHARRVHVGDAAVQAQAVEVDLQHPRRRTVRAAPARERSDVGRDLGDQRVQRASPGRPGRQQPARAQARLQCIAAVAVQQAREHRALQARPLHPARGHLQRFEVVAGVVGVGQAQLQALAQEARGRCQQETAQRIQRQRGLLACRRGECVRGIAPRRQRAARARQTPGGRVPLRAIAEEARVLAAERGRRERLQRMVQHQRLRRGGGIGVLRARGGQQFRDQHRGLARAAVARVGAEPADMEHVLRGSEQLQEQEAVVVARRAIAMAPLRRALRGGEAVEPGGGIAAREIAIVHAQQADRAERQQAHRHHPREADPAGEQRGAGVGLAQHRGEMRAHHLGRHRVLVARALCGLREAIDQAAQAVQRALALRGRRRHRQHPFEHGQQRLAPTRRRHRLAEHACLPRQFAQQAQQAVERIQRAAFQPDPRRDLAIARTGDLGLVAAGMAQQQAIQRELPGPAIVGGRALLRAVRGIQPPAGAGLAQPAAQAFDVGGLQAVGLGQRRAGQQVEDFLQPEARQRQPEQAQEHVGQRFVGERTRIGQRVGNRMALALPAEHRIQVRHVGIDVRGQHRDLARLQRRVEARVLEQPAQAVVQHLQFAQPGMAGVELQAGVVGLDLGAQRRGRRCAAMEQVALQAAQQALLHQVRAVVVPAGLRVDVGGELARGMHHLVAAEQGHEIAARRAPVAQQRVLVGIAGERILARAQARAERLQVAPVRTARGGQVEMQGADARLGGEHAQHVGRDVEGGEGEQPRRQAGGQRVAVAEAREVGLDPPCAMSAAARDRAPQDRLRIVGVGAAVPAQQPVAPPGLVFLEDPGEFAGQRPAPCGIVVVEIARERRHRRQCHQPCIGQRCVEPPAQPGGVEFVIGLAEVRVQRAGDEFAGGQEGDVGGDPMARGQCRLQPAPHRHLRDQHGVRLQQRLPGHAVAQGFGQQPREHVERVRVVEAEVGRGAHRCRIVPEPGRRVGDRRPRGARQRRRPPCGGLRSGPLDAIGRVATCAACHRRPRRVGSGGSPSRVAA